MKKRWLPIILFVLVFMLVSLACGKSTKKATPTEPPAPTAALEQPTEAVEQPTEVVEPPTEAVEAPTEAAVSGGENSGIIDSVTMAKDISGDNKDPVDPTDTFVDPKIIHAVVSIKDAPAGTKVGIEWFTNKVDGYDPDQSMGTYELETSGTRNLDFSFAPKSHLPAGTYYVNIMVNGNVDQRVDFSVTAQ
jgi:hypothetical protein